jgi:5-bromo-4-chloroindolyl phosphate hydrolysis protein
LNLERPREPSSGVARRVRSTPDAGAVAAAAAMRQAWTLRLAPLLLIAPLVTSLIAGNVGDVVGLALAILLCYAGMLLVERGLRAEADYVRRALATAPRLPRKLLGAIVVGIGVFVGSASATGAGLPLSLLFGALAAVGCVLAYGMDPSKDKGLAPELARRAGVKTEQVIEAITEAEGKLREIEQLAGSLNNRELTARLLRIVTQGRAVLAQIEKDPADLRRARRFLVTYLDGTRDVVRKYREQQSDLADTELAENFRHVLHTVERVFAEQQEVLKRNETMDLEVQIEVLRTQLEREGVS